MSSFNGLHNIWLGYTSDGTNQTGGIIGTSNSLPIIFENSSVERMRITSTGDVGIGTSAPEAQLHVIGGNARIDAALVLHPSNGTTATSSVEVGSGRTGLGISHIDLIGDTTYRDHGLRLARGAGPDGGSYLLSRGTGRLGLITQDAAPIEITTANALRMTITATGNVGIGTTVPTSRLHVNGDLKLDGTLKFASGQLIEIAGETTSTGAPVTDGLVVRYEPNLFGTAADGLVFEKTDFNQTTIDGGFLFAVRPSTGLRTTAMSVRGNGNVGIGTNNPRARIEISRLGSSTFSLPVLNANTGLLVTAGGGSSGSGAGISLVGGNTSQTGVYFGDVDNAERGGMMYDHTTDRLDLRAGGGHRVFITATGDVGIGTSAPDARLDVEGTVKLGTNGTEFSSIIRTTNSIDAPSIAANSTGEMTVAISGVLTGSTASVSPALALSSGLVIAYVRTGTNAVVIGFRNTTGAAIDQGAINFFITVINP
jgi:hypothetical protein